MKHKCTPSFEFVGRKLYCGFKSRRFFEGVFEMKLCCVDTSFLNLVPRAFPFELGEALPISKGKSPGNAVEAFSIDLSHHSSRASRSSHIPIWRGSGFYLSVLKGASRFFPPPLTNKCFVPCNLLSRFYSSQYLISSRPPFFYLLKADK